MIYPRRLFLFIVLAIVACALLMIAPQPGIAATTYSVNPGEMIQNAIDASTSGDTIIVRAGTYTGVGNRDLDFGGKAITLKSESGADVTIIDCEGTSTNRSRGFYFNSGEDSDAVVDGFTITNGYTTDNGGGIHCRN